MGLLKVGAELHAMETRTPVTYTNDCSSSSSSRGRHGCVVLCNKSGVTQIKLGPSSNVALQPPRYHHDHSPHRLQQQRGADATRKQVTSHVDEIRHRARSLSPRHAEPSAPGQQTLLRPWATRTGISTSTNGQPGSYGEHGGQKPVEATTRPPPFNPSCSTNTHVETHQPDYVEQSADGRPAVGETQSISSGSITSASGGDQNTMPPPSYDELYGDQNHQYNDHNLQQQQPQDQQQQENSFQTSNSTETSTSDESVVCSSSLPCITKFGQYTDQSSHPQPGWLTNPTRISVRVDQTFDHPESPAVMVIDQCTSTVHVFTSKGDCLSLLRVPQINGGCFIGHNPPQLLLLAVGTSVSVYEMDGRLIKEIPLRGRQEDAVVLTTVPYGERGFVAVRPRSLSICRGGITRPAVVHTVAGRYQVDRGTTPFVNVIDVAVDSRRGHLVVLDGANPSVSSHRSAVYVMTEDGSVLLAIRPTRDPRCGAMLQPFGVTVDRGGNVLVSDGGRLV